MLGIQCGDQLLWGRFQGSFEKERKQRFNEAWRGQRWINSNEPWRWDPFIDSRQWGPNSRVQVWSDSEMASLNLLRWDKGKEHDRKSKRNFTAIFPGFQEYWRGEEENAARNKAGLNKQEKLKATENRQAPEGRLSSDQP